MRIGVQTGGIEEVHGIDGTYRLIKESGFDAADANVDHLLSGGEIARRECIATFMGSDRDCLSHFHPWKDAAEKYGVENYQAHAPFPSFVGNENDEYNDFLITMLKKTIMGCDYMGCHNLIVHPFFLGYEQQMEPEREWNLNIAQYARLIPEAKKYGVTVCLENMFVGHQGKMYGACCSDIDTACRYIDTLNAMAGEKCFGFCLDTGHLLLVGKDIKQAMIRLGDRISAFHVHDNDGRYDLHLAPYMGVQDWDRFVEGLKAIRFDKTLSFETFNVWNVVDHALCPTMLRYIAESGRLFASRALEA